MSCEPDASPLRLRFGPRQGFAKPGRKVARMAIQLVFLLTLIAFAMRRPNDSKGSGETSANVPGTALIAPGTPSNPLPEGMFLASADEPQKKLAANDSQTPEKAEAVDSPAGDSAQATIPEKTPVADLPFLMESVVDLDRDLPPALYYHFLDKARQTDSVRLIGDARRDVTFSHLYRDPRNDPAKYRGQLLGLRGTVRRALAYDLDKNAYGLTKRYELWIFTPDSGKFPWVVQLTELPPDFPLGNDLREEVETAGYFLKLWAYRAQDGFRSAPLLLGHGLSWRRADMLRSRFERQFAWATAGFLGLFLVLLAGVVLKWRREDGRLRRSFSKSAVYDRLDEIPVNDTPRDGSFS